MNTTPLCNFTTTGTRIDNYIGENLSNVVISDRITEIGHSAFASVSHPEVNSIKSVFIPDSVSRIGRYAFYMAKKLTTVRLPANLKRLEEKTFASCYSLESLLLPQGLQFIGYGAISHTSILKLVLPASVTELDEGAFCRTKLNEIVIPDSVRTIGKDAFRDTPNITIRTTANSCAERYARTYGIPVSIINQTEMDNELTAIYGSRVSPQPSPSPKPSVPASAPPEHPSLTIEDAVKLAEQGDVAAMISLGDYYVQKKDGESIEQAYKWYEMAADHNIVYAIHMALLTKTIEAEAGFMVATKVEYGVSFALDEWKLVCKWAAKEIDCISNHRPGTENLKIDEAIERLKNATYHYALCSYWLGDYAKVCELVSGSDETRAKILYGSSLVQLGTNNNDMAEAALILAPAVGDEEYVNVEKSQLEEDAYRVASITLSRLHKIVDDLDNAVSILIFMSNAVRRDNNKQAIADELSHYKKKLFGGYKYIG